MKDASEAWNLLAVLKEKLKSSSEKHVIILSHEEAVVDLSVSAFAQRLQQNDHRHQELLLAQTESKGRGSVVEVVQGDRLGGLVVPRATHGHSLVAVVGSSVFEASSLDGHCIVAAWDL